MHSIYKFINILFKCVDDIGDKYNTDMKKRKIIFLRGILCTFIVALVVVFIIIKMKGIHFLCGSVTTTFSDIEYDDGTFLIRADNELYMDPFLDINGVKSNYKVTIKEGDSVCAVCKVSSKEISPKTIRIYFIFRL